MPRHSANGPLDVQWWVLQFKRSFESFIFWVIFVSLNSNSGNLNISLISLQSTV